MDISLCQRMTYCHSMYSIAGENCTNSSDPLSPNAVNIIPPFHLLLNFWHDGVMVMASDSLLRSHRFGSWLSHCHAMTVGRLFTHMVSSH